MNRSLNGHVDSFYAAQSGGLPVYDRLIDDRKTQVCIIGGGLAGLSCASELAARGFDVVLLEGNRLGWAASGRNGGFVSDGFAQGMSDVVARTGIETAKKLFKASVEGVEIVRSNIQTARRDDLIQGHGGLKLIRTADDSGLRKQLGDYRSFFDTERSYVSKNNLNRYINSNAYHAALYNENAFHIDPIEYCELMAHSTTKTGAALFENSKAHSIRKRRIGWEVECDGAYVRADHVVIATSGYGGVFAPITGSMVPVSTYVVASKPQGSKFDNVIDFTGTMADTRRAGDYFRVVGKGDDRRLIWGGRITTRRSEPKKLAHMLAKDISDVFPQLRGLEIEYAWSGLMGYTRHKMPLIGQFWPKTYKNLWTCTGFGGHGLNTTAMGGRIIGEALSKTSNRTNLFQSYRPVWTGGPIGRVVAQLSYWNMQRLDSNAELSP